MIKTIEPEISILIPFFQYIKTEDNIENFQNELIHLEKQYLLCPKLHETDDMTEHPAMFHYYNLCYDLFICEYEKESGKMYGLEIFDSDIKKMEWVYYDISFITKIPFINIEYNFGGHSIEALLYRIYPQHFKKPPSLGGKK